ncbi:MAG: hypothetical protein ACE5D6_05905 [Candidatus Zixiibacteriota bacterium]
MLQTLGRGYLLAFLAVIITALLSAIVLFKNPSTHAFILGYWKDFLMYFVVPIVVGKEIGKIGTTFGKGYINKHNKDDTQP